MQEVVRRTAPGVSEASDDPKVCGESSLIVLLAFVMIYSIHSVPVELFTGEKQTLWQQFSHILQESPPFSRYRSLKCSKVRFSTLREGLRALPSAAAQSVASSPESQIVHGSGDRVILGFL